MSAVAAVALTGKLIDLAIVALDYFAARDIRITELAAEIEMARKEGREPNVQRFKDQADTAQAAAHAHLDEVKP